MLGSPLYKKNHGYGSIIGLYVLGKTLGIGSFSKVKIGEHISTHQKVAIKILNKQKLKSADMQEKVRREINILQLFDHPHIIRLYEVIDTPTDIFVVMEHSPNGELFDYIVSKNHLSEWEGRVFFQQIISGVDYCHKRHIVHRDLKPENLLLSQNGVKIADFGLSNIMKDGQFLKTSCGSPNYAAPEVIMGNYYAGPEVDVWSCGVILYALLCGNLPFDDQSIAALFTKIKSGKYRKPVHLSHNVQDLISKALIVNPMKRIQISEIREHPWFKEGIAPYLSEQYSFEPVKYSEQEIDQDLIKNISKLLCYTEDVCTSALRKYTLSDFYENEEAKKIVVAYTILLREKQSNKHKKQIDEINRISKIKNKNYNGDNNPKLKTSKYDIISNSQLHWKLGLNITIKSDTPTLLNRLYNILRLLELRWVHIDTFQLYVRRLCYIPHCTEDKECMYQRSTANIYLQNSSSGSSFGNMKDISIDLDSPSLSQQLSSPLDSFNYMSTSLDEIQSMDTNLSFSNTNTPNFPNPTTYNQPTPTHNKIPYKQTCTIFCPNTPIFANPATYNQPTPKIPYKQTPSTSISSPTLMHNSKGLNELNLSICDHHVPIHVVFSIQLFTREKGKITLDFMQISGPLFPFLNATAQLINKMEESFSVNSKNVKNLENKEQIFLQS